MSPQKKRIMIAEDDEGIMDVMKIILEDAGYDITPSIDGHEIYNLHAPYPDIFLLDIWMSGADGSEICRYIKSHDTLSQIPVLLVSANKDTQHIARRVGADDFLCKPFEMDELLAKVAHYITKYASLKKGKAL